MCIICKYECGTCTKPNYELNLTIDTMLAGFCPRCLIISKHYLNCRKCHYEMGSGINACHDLYTLLQNMREAKVLEAKSQK